MTAEACWELWSFPTSFAAKVVQNPPFHSTSVCPATAHKSDNLPPVGDVAGIGSVQASGGSVLVIRSCIDHINSLQLSGGAWALKLRAGTDMIFCLVR